MLRHTLKPCLLCVEREQLELGPLQSVEDGEQKEGSCVVCSKHCVLTPVSCDMTRQYVSHTGDTELLASAS
jgi:hypothetical protein